LADSVCIGAEPVNRAQAPCREIGNERDGSGRTAPNPPNSALIG